MIRYRGPGILARKALAGFARALAEELSAGDARTSWLGKIEPRAKILAVIVAIVGSTLMRQIMPLSAFFVSVLALALWSGVDMKRVFKMWMVVPLFSAAILLPAVLSVVSPGKPAIVLWHSGLPNQLAVTWVGLEVAARFILRTMSCVTLTLLLAMTTDHTELVNGLRRLGMPKVFGMALVMMGRYLSLMLKAAQEIHLAKLSRTMAIRSTRDEQKWAAAGMGMLFRRTHRLAGEVNRAMISRGYTGEVRLHRLPPLRPSDLMATVVVTAFTVVLVAADRMM